MAITPEGNGSGAQAGANYTTRDLLMMIWASQQEMRRDMNGLGERVSVLESQRSGEQQSHDRAVAVGVVWIAAGFTVLGQLVTLAVNLRAH